MENQDKERAETFPPLTHGCASFLGLGFRPFISHLLILFADLFLLASMKIDACGIQRECQRRRGVSLLLAIGLHRSVRHITLHFVSPLYGRRLRRFIDSRKLPLARHPEFSFVSEGEFEEKCYTRFDDRDDRVNGVHHGQSTHT